MLTRVSELFIATNDLHDSTFPSSNLFMFTEKDATNY